jgi:hypothetical protein
MQAPLRFGLVLASFVVLFSTAGLNWVRWGRDRQAVLEIMTEELERSRELDEYGRAFIERVLQRNAVREELVEQVLAGRLTLWQAAARFKAADATLSPVQQASHRSAFPGETEDERYCREVIFRVEGVLEWQPRRATAVTPAQLKEELERLLAREGIVHLAAHE